MNMCPISNKGTPPISNLAGQVVSVKLKPSATIKHENPADVNQSLLVLNLLYATKATIVTKTARIKPVTCIMMWNMCCPWKKWGKITGIAKIRKIPTVTMENKVDLLSSSTDSFDNTHLSNI